MPAALSVARPAVAALALVAAVAITGLMLHLFWPVGVAVGLALGALAVLAVGARMQLTERLEPTDVELQARLGITPEPLFDAGPAAAAPAAAAPAPAAPTAVAHHVVAPTSTPTPTSLEPDLGVAVPGRGTDVEDRTGVSEEVLDAGSGPSVVYFPSDAAPGAAEARVLVADTSHADTVHADILQAEAQHADSLHADSLHTDAVRTDLEGLKADLGDDYRDFARAARLVVSTQYASAARLQRDLELTYSRARRLLGTLEEQHFVGPATGTLPRQVLMPKERLPEVEALLADA